MQQGSNTSEAEIRLMGLILAQSALVGLAIGLFDADMWLNTNDPLVNGFTYAMAAFFVQGIAYYFFKMFFEQNMQERVRIQNMENAKADTAPCSINLTTAEPKWNFVCKKHSWRLN